MKRFILPLVIIFTNQLFPQDSTSQQIDLSGKYALQFQIAENLKLSSFNGTVFSGKYDFNNSLALRLGVSFSSREEDAGQTQSDLNTSLTSNINNENSDYSIDFKPQLLISNSIIDDINFYWGGGLLISYYYNKQIARATPDSLLTVYNTTNSGFGYGLEGVAGVEWFLKSNISLSAEYGFQINHFSTDSEQVRKGKNQNVSYKVDYSYTRIGGSYVRLGVSVYF